MRRSLAKSANCGLSPRPSRLCAKSIHNRSVFLDDSVALESRATQADLNRIENAVLATAKIRAQE